MIPKDLADILSKAGSVYGVGAGGTITDIKSGKQGDKLVLSSDGEIDLDEVEEEKPLDLGKYKSKRKYYDFMCAFGNINFLSKKAVIDGKFFDSLNLEGVKFQMNLKDEGTFDFEEVVPEGSIAKTTEADHKRFVDMFDDVTISGFREKSVYSDFIFHIEYPVTDENRKSLKRSFPDLKDEDDKVEFHSYLIVEPKKPFNELLNIFEEDDEPIDMSKMEQKLENNRGEETLQNELVEKLNNVDLSFLDDEEDVVETKEPPTPLPIPAKEELTGTRAQIAEEFSEAKKEKRRKLQETLSNHQEELKKAKNQQSLAFTKIRECNDEIKTLVSRIDSLDIHEPLNGYFIFIPKVLSEKTFLDETTRKTIQDKLVAMNYPNTDYFMHLFDNAVFQIHIGCNTEEGLVELQDFKNVLKYFKDFDLTSQYPKIYVEKNKLFYEGQMEHAALINKLVKLGFSENPEFNEMCAAQHQPTDEEKMMEMMGMATPGYQSRNQETKEEDYDDEDDKGPEAEFEAEMGYQMGDEFIFAIQYDKAEDPQVCVAITPLSYWNNESCCYDQHIEHILHSKFPALQGRIEEASEGNFFISNEEGDYMHLQETIEFLSKSGLKFSTAFQNFMSNKDTGLVQFLVESTDSSIII
jgi:hypothetical protein